jgi:hypothetical protein
MAGGEYKAGSALFWLSTFFRGKHQSKTCQLQSFQYLQESAIPSNVVCPIADITRLFLEARRSSANVGGMVDSDYGRSFTTKLVAKPTRQRGAAASNATVARRRAVPSGVPALSAT